MKLNPGSRTRILIDMSLDIDPTGSTIELKIDNTWHAAEWVGTPSGRWRQTARTVGYFAGPDATASGATVLTVGRHLTSTRVTSGGDILTAPSTPIDVMA